MVQEYASLFPYNQVKDTFFLNKFGNCGCRSNLFSPLAYFSLQIPYQG